MKCEYCDSSFRKLPETGHCPNCGAPLQRKRGDTVRPFPKAPVGIYKDAAGYLQIEEDSVTFHRKHLLRGYSRTIPLRELHAVAYTPGRPLNSGYLTVRERKNSHLPLPSKTADAVLDETSVYFHHSCNSQFEQIYHYLRQCLDILNEDD